jgi:hypothetical protein
MDERFRRFASANPAPPNNQSHNKNPYPVFHLTKKYAPRIHMWSKDSQAADDHLEHARLALPFSATFPV